MNILDVQQYFTQAHSLEIILFCIIENILLVLFAIVAGRVLEKSWVKFTSREKRVVTAAIVINIIITIAGFYLYTSGIIHFSTNQSVFITIREVMLIMLGMDFLMFLFHYTTHKWNLLYRYHKLHHEHIHTRLENLFVLHPIEVLGFGMIWLAFISLFAFSFPAVVIYLIINFIWGLAGHYSKEIISSKYWISNVITNTAFHHLHHEDEQVNYGFYFTFWDKALTWLLAKK